MSYPRRHWSRTHLVGVEPLPHRHWNRFRSCRQAPSGWHVSSVGQLPVVQVPPQPSSAPQAFPLHVAVQTQEPAVGSQALLGKAVHGVHTPPAHTPPVPLQHVPAWAGSATQVPPWQVRQTPQAPHATVCPQLLTAGPHVLFRQAAASSGTHAHVPPSQVCVARQAAPQPPQLAGSVLGSTQAPPQQR